MDNLDDRGFGMPIDCLGCNYACECHNEFVHIIADVRNAQKMVSNGAMIQAIEDLETILKKLDKMEKQRVGRI